ncbi:ArsR/SmtB family transcription factor [Dyella nitratireducens]|uniref:Transcriptional regulator n=1 Tax=Dyella nitratireducens TaxID=1849580 RepID=A0ABQ1FX48_9GAMM|nr:metalloregulator ArsR/SmtB family transcription factor [Dyella nitratireducens]GGA32414.1 transcriptional regulator [Dyella nitratireducens]GLQ42746.1 transcriptional regulator [Dyella nitratireducens]
MQIAQTVKMLSALAQESRLAIFRLLVEQGPEGLPVGTIGETLGIPNATLSFHLKELLYAGLVTSRQSGRFVYYAPVIEAMNDLVGYLTENCCQGQSCARPATRTSKPRTATTSRTRRRAT